MGRHRARYEAEKGQLRRCESQGRYLLPTAHRPLPTTHFKAVPVVSQSAMMT